MARFVRALGAGLVAAALASACSKSSTQPPPSVAGTWHVTVGTLTQGAVNPPTFDITLSQQGTTYTGTMPNGLGWMGMSFDSLPDVEVHGDSLYAALDAAPQWTQACAQLGLVAKFNAARDTAIGVFYVAPSQMNSNPISCTATGPVTVAR